MVLREELLERVSLSNLHKAQLMLETMTILVLVELIHLLENALQMLPSATEELPATIPELQLRKLHKFNVQVMSLFAKGMSLKDLKMEH